MGATSERSEPQAQAVTPYGYCFPEAWAPPLPKVLGHRDPGPTILSVVPLLLSKDLGSLHPLNWLSSVSKISICRRSLGSQRVTSNCWVKVTVVSTLLFISLLFTKMESHPLEAGCRGGCLEMCQQRKKQKQEQKSTIRKVHETTRALIYKMSRQLEKAYLTCFHALVSDKWW